ncbi:protein YgfX [Thalassotalea sp. ND16A]|uniref:protein YgfX n=1 Tax=Thalassotalea sp. ND16A TaxID=1535422 RepID=UPI00051D8C65|nr:protein YgfX [Thalassotalea sp. ND16A]KGJ97696.1 hypothetical protein ND16A_0975 [Thalassotalea sp. ND16A]
MKHSTPWYNLYSTELKYNFRLTPSKIAAQVPRYLAGLMFLISCLLLLNFGLSLSYAQVFILSTIIAGISYLLVQNLAIAQLFSLGLAHSHSECRVESKSLLLSQEGGLTLGADQHYQLCSDSFVFPFGCALALRKRLPQAAQIPLQPQCDENSLRLFVFKDSLSSGDYRRLCRIVQYIKH